MIGLSLTNRRIKGETGLTHKVYGGNAFKPSYCCSFSNQITQAVTQADVMTSFERKSLHRRHEPSGSCNLKDKEMLEYKDRGF